MLRAIAIDDEPIALDIIKMYVEKVPFIALEKSFVDATQAKEYVEGEDVDLLFLDIRMSKLSGIEFYKSLERKPLLIFTTAYSEYALMGFEMEAVDYLLKPFSFERFLKACQKAQDTHLIKGIETAHIFVKDGFDIVRIDFKDLLYIEATGNYVSYVLTDKVVMVRATFKETLDSLPSDIFVQTHRSYIVNVKQIEKMEKGQVSIAGRTLPISASYSEGLKMRLL